jgi:predicted acetyltransferase
VTAPEGEDVRLEPAGPEQKRTLAHLLELYMHDLSEAFAMELGPDGRFGYRQLSPYFEQPDRHFAFLVRAGPHLAGFALAARGSPATDDPEDLDVVEFFVVRRHRRSGVGRSAAFALFDRIPGSWVVRVVDRNRRGLPFWSEIIPAYTNGRFERGRLPPPRDDWHVFRFRSRAGGA